jgi:hypothetical protein
MGRALGMAWQPTQKVGALGEGVPNLADWIRRFSKATILNDYTLSL